MNPEYPEVECDTRVIIFYLVSYHSLFLDLRGTLIYSFVWKLRRFGKSRNPVKTGTCLDADLRLYDRKGIYLVVPWKWYVVGIEIIIIKNMQ